MPRVKGDPAPIGPPGQRALAAVALSAAGELLTRAAGSPGWGAVLLAAGGSCLAFDAFRVPERHGEEEPTGEERRGARWAALLCLTAAVGCALAILRLLHRDFEAQGAVALWTLALILVIGSGFLAGVWLRTPARWPSHSVGGRIRSRRGFWAALLVVVALGGVARLVGLASMPSGINPDEGDRAQVALERLESPDPPTIFGRGWYHIGNIYFALLATSMKWFGTNYAGARVLGALSGTASLAVLVFIGARNFGWFAGLAAGGLYAFWGAGLMFARENTEAGPTALLWTVAAGLLLEAARTNRLIAWIGAAVAGGVSIYFYPPGRVFPAFYLLVAAVLVLRAGRGLRHRVLVAAAAGLVAYAVTVTPFIAAMRREPGEFAVRARETTIFRRSNLARLSYVRPEWGTPRVIAAQIERSFGLFNRFGDANFFWPVDRPAATAGLSAAFFMGLVVAIWSLRDVRMFLLLTWFATGFAGIVFTVETPALQRLSCAVSAVPLIAALALDEVRRRFSFAGGARAVPGVIASAAVLAIAAREGHQFFVKEGARDFWPYPNMEGRAVASLGREVWAFSLGDMFHMVQSGWVDLLAHETPRRGIRTPGSYLPVPLEADRDLAFVVYPRQFFFLPYLRDLYPGGKVQSFALDPQTPVVSVYRVPREAWSATRGVVRRAASGDPETVSSFGELPAGASRGPLRWSATVRVARSWNYVFVTGGGPGRLSVDGGELERVGGGERERTSVVFLPRGDHAVRLETPAGPRDARPFLLLGEADPGGSPAAWRAAARPIASSALGATESPVRGLLGRFEFPGRPTLMRLDGTIASGGFNEEVGYHGPYRAVWKGSIRIARPGRYAFRFFVNGVTVDLAIAARSLHIDGLEEQSVVHETDLEAGVHPVSLTMNVLREPGALEWAWRPPEGEESIVPPAVLEPPPGAGSGPPRSVAELGSRDDQPSDREPQARH
jgi:hypothetical protein